MENGGAVVDLRSAVEEANAAVASLHEIESLCMRCGKNGVTRLLLMQIPHFREVVLMALECPHCSERNNEVQFAGQLQPKGSRWDEVRWKGFLYVLWMSCKSFKVNETCNQGRLESRSWEDRSYWPVFGKTESSCIKKCCFYVHSSRFFWK